MPKTFKNSAKEISHHAISVIKNAKNSYKTIAAVMAPIFDDKNITEGYIQRVKAIDDEILKDTFNIYVDFETKNTQPTISQIDERHMLITFMPHCKYCVKELVKILKHCDLLYTHSVMRAMADIIGQDIHKIYKLKDIFKIWDVHGAVPEEFALADNYFEAQNAGEAEELFINNSDIIISVNQAMKHHLEKKYDKILQNTIILPIFNTQTIDFEQMISQKPNDTPPCAVYAGGLQEWQNILLMQDTIKKAGDKYSYRMFVSDKDLFKEMWGDAFYPSNIEIDYKPSQEVLKSYETCHYGFVLRDDITVNNVACPTKLIEYLQFGIVPILKTDKIGDFAKLGMQFISYEQFIKNPPSNNEYQKMAQNNFKIIDLLLQIHQKGEKELQDKLYEKFDF